MDNNKEAKQLEWQINHDAALRAHQGDSDWQKIMMDSSLKFAEGAIKAITLTAGGAVVVGLAFIGSIYGSEPNLAKALVPAVFLLAGGAICAAMCAGLAYVAQYFYARASMQKLHKWEHPYVESTGAAKPRNVAGAMAHLFALAAAVLSFALLIWGGISSFQVLVA